MKKIILAVCILTFSVSCQKKYSSPQDNGGRQKISLIGLDPREVIRLKYEKFHLQCNLYIKGSGNDLDTGAPNLLSLNQSLSIDAIEALNAKSGIVLGSEELHFFAVITPLRLEVQPYRVHMDELGQSFGLKNSPELVIQLEWHGGNSSKRSKGQSQTRLVETFQTPILTWNQSQSHPLTKGPYPADTFAIRCRIDARSKPEYRDEFYKK